MIFLWLESNVALNDTDTHTDGHRQRRTQTDALEMVKQISWSAEKSAKILRTDAAAISKSTNVAWSCAKKSPLFMRRPKFIGTGKTRKRATMTNRFGVEVNIPQRANRCVRTAVYKTLLSGGAASANEILQAEGFAFKADVEGEANVAAALPKMSTGAEIMLEHAIGAYTKTIFDVAARVKDSMNMHSKVSMGCMLAACEIVNRSVFSSGLAPATVIFDTAARATKKKKKKVAADPKADAADDAADEA